jgi:hypothetical protein
MVSPYEQRIIDSVAQFGWFVVSVAPGENSDDAKEWWSYTVGLPISRGWPELVIFGQDPKLGHGILEAAIRDCDGMGVAPHSGLHLRNTLKGYDAVLADGDSIPPHYVNSANWFARHNGVAEPRRLQLLWPDDEGLFPPDPECSPEVRRMQTPHEAQ